jgi:hypothetical protein
MRVMPPQGALRRPLAHFGISAARQLCSRNFVPFHPST